MPFTVTERRRGGSSVEMSAVLLLVDFFCSNSVRPVSALITTHALITTMTSDEKQPQTIHQTYMEFFKVHNRLLYAELHLRHSGLHMVRIPKPLLINVMKMFMT